MVIKETPIFTKQIQDIVSDDEYSLFQNLLIENPTMGAIIKNSGGIRKTRIAAKGKGKRGGARILYYWISNEEQIFMLLAYTKNETDNLSAEQLKILKTIVKNELG
jgi:hypothetical protein